MLAKTWAAKNAATFARHNPITGEEATRAAAASVEDAKAAADAAAAAFPKWSAMGPSARRAILNKAADLLEQRAQQFATLVMAETGATAGWGHFNIHLAAGMLREAAAMTTQIQGEVVPSDVPGNMAMAIRQPVGVVLGIAPWNAPIILGVRAVAMPLACGNTVILKASEVCPATHRLIAATLRDAGMADGVINVITHEPKDAEKVTDALIGASGREARELHGLHARRQDHRRAVGEVSEALPARARWQGAAHRAGRCGSRSGRGCHGVRCVREPGPDLHVDRARDLRREGRGCVRRQAREARGRAAER